MKSVPTLEDWENYKSNLDSISAFKRFYGKSNDEIIKDFYYGVTETLSEFLYMPNKPFKYYIFSLAEFVRKGEFHPIYSRASVSAGTLIDIVLGRVKIDKKSIIDIAEELSSYFQYISENIDIYNSEFETFEESLKELNLFLK